MYGPIDPGPEPIFEEDSQDVDVEMTIEEEEQRSEEDGIMEHDPVSNVKEDRIIVAIDFGTTFSSVAYAVLRKGVRPEMIDFRDVKCIGNYPGYEPIPGVWDSRQDVPTELWYDDGHRSTNGTDNDQQSDNEAEESSSDIDPYENEQLQSEEEHGSEENAVTQHRDPRTTPVTQYWGYGVQQLLNTTNIPRDEARPLTRFKLNLDDKKETEDVRTETRTILKALTKKRIIKNDTDIYAHYLTHLLKHTKEQLLLANELSQDMLVQFVLCVPAKWPVRGCRIMQTALEVAVKEANMSERAVDSVHNMFMISEPEAAAECILAEARSELYVRLTLPL